MLVGEKRITDDIIELSLTQSIFFCKTISNLSFNKNVSKIKTAQIKIIFESFE